MRVLLKDTQSGLYCDERGSWVHESSAAMNFQTIHAAGAAALGSKHLDTSVVIQYDDPNCEVALNPDYCVPAAAWLGAAKQPLSNARIAA